MYAIKYDCRNCVRFSNAPMIDSTAPAAPAIRNRRCSPASSGIATSAVSVYGISTAFEACAGHENTKTRKHERRFVPAARFVVSWFRGFVRQQERHLGTAVC